MPPEVADKKGDRYLDRRRTQPHYPLDVMGLSDTIYGTKAKKDRYFHLIFLETSSIL